jgi:hypothetical protein
MDKVIEQLSVRISSPLGCARTHSGFGIQDDDLDDDTDDEDGLMQLKAENSLSRKYKVQSPRF